MRCNASPIRFFAGPPHVFEWKVCWATRYTLDEQVPPMAGLLLAKGGHHQMPMQGELNKNIPQEVPTSCLDHQGNT
jgi:hypothetical protein